MIRRLFILTSILSLLVCIATLVLWAISYRLTVTLSAQPPPHNTTCGDLSSDRGAFEIGLAETVDDMRPPGGWDIQLFSDAVRSDLDIFRSTWYGRLWFQYQWFPPAARGVFRWRGAVLIPDWCVILPTLVMPATLFLRRFRHRDGLCRTCGYDLRASPDRCPECGTAIPQKTEARA